MRARDDRRVCRGRRKQYRLSEMSERGVETLGLKRLVDGLLRRERGRLPHCEVDQRLLRGLPPGRREPRGGLFIVAQAQQLAHVAEALEERCATFVRRRRLHGLVRACLQRATARLAHAYDAGGKLSRALQLARDRESRDHFWHVVPHIEA